ncbi:MAG: PKD domain-containing protein [Bacteroidota bacterium]
MKKYYKIIFALLLTLPFISCESDDDSLVDLNQVQEPANLGATFQITQDNSGLVSITPTGESANMFSVDFGDGSEAASEIRPGESVDHVYKEGDYEVAVTGTNLNGKTSTGVQPLTVSFRQPENLTVSINRAEDDNYTITVSAEADYAAMFEVYFGDQDDEEPTPFMIGESATHTYDAVGDYDVRVVALSGGAASLEETQTVSITDPLFLPIDFESETLNYTFYNFGGGEGAGVPIIDNPDPTGINTSDKVASYTKPAGSETWAGTTIPLDEPIDLSSNKYISMDVWSPAAGTPVTFKIENLDDADIAVETTVQTTVGNEWETLTFDMSAVDPAIEYGRIVLFFNLDTPGADETYYFDNIQTTTLEPLKLPMNFDSDAVTYAADVFSGTSFEVVSNPDQSGANTSASMVGAITNSGNTWEGISFNLEEPADFSGDDKTITMKFWSDVATPILLKFEGGVNGERQNEVSANHSGSGWEEISFNFSTDAVKSYIDGNQGVGEAFVPTGEYGIMTIFVDGPGNTAGTFYLDDINMGAYGGPTSVALPLFFESEDLTYTWNGFGGASGAVISNPDPSGINTSTKVTELIKPDGAQTWAGISMDLEEAVNFANGTTINLKAWSPKEGATILFKFEDSESEPNQDGNPSVVVEVAQSTTTSNQWEEMSFDLTSFEAFNTGENYDRVVIFYDYGTAGEGSSFYFDDIQLTN